VLKHDPEMKKTFETELEQLVQADLEMRGETAAFTNPQVDLQRLMGHIREVGGKLLGSKRTVRKHADWFEKNRARLRVLVRRKLDAHWRLKSSTEKDRKGHTKAYQEACAKLNTEMRRSRDNFFRRRAVAMQLLADKHDYGGLFTHIKRKYGPAIVKGASGSVNAAPSLEAFYEHFRVLLSHPAAHSEDMNQYLPEQMSVNNNLARPFSEEELRNAIALTINGSAVGEDMVDGLALQCCVGDAFQELLRVFNDILVSGIVPSEIKDATITPLFKNGAQSLPDNYRGLAVGNHIGKVLERLVLCRINEHNEQIQFIPDTQCGFMVGKGTVDAINMNHEIAGATLRVRAGRLYRCYIDLKKAYDKVSRPALWIILARLGIPPTLITLIKSLHDGATACVKVNGQLSSPITLSTGLKQGSVISPMLFNIMFGAIVHAARTKYEQEGLEWWE